MEAYRAFLDANEYHAALQISATRAFLQAEACRKRLADATQAALQTFPREFIYNYLIKDEQTGAAFFDFIQKPLEHSPLHPEFEKFLHTPIFPFSGPSQEPAPQETDKPFASISAEASPRSSPAPAEDVPLPSEVIVEDTLISTASPATEALVDENMDVADAPIPTTPFPDLNDTSSVVEPPSNLAGPVDDNMQVDASGVETPTPALPLFVNPDSFGGVLIDNPRRRRRAMSSPERPSAT